MTTKHTPGPWIQNDLTRRGASGLYRWRICTDEGRDADVIATVPAPGMDTNPGGEDPVAEANARLIAAAPDLLAALRAIADMSIDIDSNLGEVTALCMAIASAAIAKVEAPKEGV